MAAAHDRGSLEGILPPWRRWKATWLGVIGIGLGLALLAVVLVQSRQATLLNQAVQLGDDHVVISVYQAETEYLRLVDQWHRAADAREPLDVALLQMRYDIWMSRVGLLHESRSFRVLGSQPDYRDALNLIDAFVARADRLLGAQPSMKLSPDALQSLEADLVALGKPVQSISLLAAHHMGDKISQRNVTVRRHNQIGLGLTVFLSALILAFALITLRQRRQLELRRSVLETLAANLRQARRDAEAASEAKSVFLANMSHEIRTPFHGLMGMLSLLRETGLNARQIDYLRTASESADHLLVILNDILDLSQLESGRMTLSPVPLDLRTMLRDVEALMRPLANDKQLALHLDADATVPARVLADATRVRQIVFNLLSNAIKFSDRGAVELNLRVGKPDAGQPAHLEFVVSDNGVGMDEATQASLFTRSVQGDSPPARHLGGAGLGLEISRNLARLMGGDISVHSLLGEGSTFRFFMPLHPVGELAPLDLARAEAAELPSRILNVLVAEDHPVNRQYMAALLDSMGHKALFTADGREAVDAVRQRHGEPAFDIVLMDLHMPVLDGLDATREIRALPDAEAATVPIVALTADAFPETRARCLVAGMNDFLTKPVSPPKLAATLRRLFGTAAMPPLDADGAPQGAPFNVDEGATLIDRDALASALRAMPSARVAALIHEFLDQGPHTVQRLRAAVRNADALELQANAHAAQGAALNLGLSALAATAGALHQGATHLAAHEIARTVQRFDEQLAQTRQAAIDYGLLPVSTITE
jgi:signal transduction histidine kinase/DNA-binding response OmpR family regulator